MRIELALVCLMAAACGSEQELRHTSTLEAQTDGLALSENGVEAHAAMSGTTCTIDPQWGCPVADADLPSAEEAVLDHVNGVTLGRSPKGLHKVDGSGWIRGDDIPQEDVKTARLVTGGAAMIWGNADSCHRQDDDGPASEVPGDACADGAQVDVDRQAGTLFVASADGLLAVNQESTDRLQRVTEDLVAWDSNLRQLYVAHKGSTTLRAVSRKGDERWSWESEGEIQSLDARGKRGEVMVLSAGADGFGIIDRLNGQTGEEEGSTDIPVTDAEVEVSADGSSVAVVADGEVHFYAFEDAEAEGEVELRDPPDCIQPTRTVKD